MGRKGEAVKRLNLFGILNVTPYPVFNDSLVLLKVSGLKILQSFLKMWFYFPKYSRDLVKFYFGPRKRLGRCFRHSNTLLSTEQFSPLSEPAVVLSVINEGVIVLFRRGFHDICCLALQRLLLKSWCDCHEDFVLSLLNGSLHVR